MEEAHGSGAERGTSLRLLCLGGSHLRCIADAAEASAGLLAEAGIEIRTLRLTDARYKPTVEKAGGRHHVQPRLMREIDRLMSDCEAAYLSVGGNAHNALGLVESERPFDFVLESDPSLPLLPDREILPEAAVRAALLSTKRFEQQMLARRLLLEVFGRNAAHLETPPPILDESHILGNCGEFAAEIIKYGIAPPSVRHKLWLLHSDMVRETCAALGVELLPVPPRAIDQGFLARPAYTHDPTHANEWYGRRVIEQIVARHRPGFSFEEA